VGRARSMHETFENNKFLIGNPVRMTPLWRPSRRRHNIFKDDIKNVGCGGGVD
jgi:hypothetical protein